MADPGSCVQEVPKNAAGKNMLMPFCGADYRPCKGALPAEKAGAKRTGIRLWIIIFEIYN
jgi:hypothetical protein